MSAAPAVDPRPSPRVARPRGLHTGKTREQVAESFRKLDSWRRLLPDIHRLSSGSGQESLLWAIYNRTIAGAYDPVTRAWVPSTDTPVMYPQDFSKETGFTQQQHGEDIDNALKRGLIERKCNCDGIAGCGPQHHQYHLRIENWPLMPNFRAAAFPRKGPKAEGEDEANTRSRRPERVVQCLEKEVPLAAGCTAQLGSIEWRNGNASNTINTRIEAVNHLSVGLVITPCDAGGGTIRFGLDPAPSNGEGKAKSEEKANTRSRRLERVTPPPSAVEFAERLVRYGYTLGEARAAIVLQRLGEAPIEYFHERLEERNRTQDGRPKRRERRLPPGALPQFAAEVKENYRLEARVAARVAHASETEANAQRAEAFRLARAALANPATDEWERIWARDFLADNGERAP